MNAISKTMNGFREINVNEIAVVSGGDAPTQGSPDWMQLGGMQEQLWNQRQELLAAFGMMNLGGDGDVCPVDNWYVPDVVEDAWDGKTPLPNGNSFLIVGGTFCLYNSDSELAATYNATTSNNALVVVTYTSTDGGQTWGISATVAGTGGGLNGGSSDSNALTMTFYYG